MPTLRRHYQQPDTPDDEVLPLDTVCTILTRQSTMGQRERHAFSAEVDPKTLIAEAQRLGFSSEHIRVLAWDMGIGAYNTTIEDRPALHHWLTQLLPSGESRVVLVSQEDRLFRDRTEIQVNRFIEQVAQHRGWVICGARVYNFRRDMDKEHFRLACKYGKQYIEFHIKGRLHPALQKAAMQGRFAGGMVPWGYQVDYNQHSATYKHFLPYVPYATLVQEQVFGRFVRMVRPSVAELVYAWWREARVWPFFDASVDERQVRWYEHKCHRDEQLGGYPFARAQAQTILTNTVYLGWIVRRGEVARDTATGEPRICHEPLIDPDMFWWCYDHLVAERPPFAPRRQGPAIPLYPVRRSFTKPDNAVLFLAHGLVHCAQHGVRLAPFIPRVEANKAPSLRCWLGNRQKRELIERQAIECAVVPIAAIEQSLAQHFASQLQLEARDVEAVRKSLAKAAQWREQRQDSTVEDIERQKTIQVQRFEQAKRLALRAPDLADDIIDEMRQAKQAIEDLERRSSEVQASVQPTVRAWNLADQAIALAERIRTTFAEWSRPAQAKVLQLALERAVVGRVDLRTLGLWMRWYGGSESRTYITRPNGHRRDWTSDEDAALQAYFATLTRRALCQVLPGRALPAIYHRAYELGLSRKKGTAFDDTAPVVVSGPTTPNEMAAYGFVSNRHSDDDWSRQRAGCLRQSTLAAAQPL